MSAGTPYIGSKINLISKAEIRYQGTLYQVDTKEATVTLAKVRSFGTENRQVPKPIPPRNEIYEFIIFRGSDIKDLNVIDVPSQTEAEDSAPQDPAIVSATQAPPQTIPLIPSSQPPAPPHPRPPTYSPFPPPNVYSPFGMPYVRPPVMMGTRGTGPPPPMHHSHPAHAVPIPTQPMEMAFRPPEQSHPATPQVAMVSVPAQVQPLVVSSQQPVTAFSPGVVAASAPASSGTDPQASSTPMVPATVTAETTPKASVPLESESPGLGTRAQPSVPVGDRQYQSSTSRSEPAESNRGNQPVVDSTTEPEDRSGGRGKVGQERGGRRGRNQNRQYDGRGGYRGSNRRGFRGNYRGAPRGGYRSQGQRPPRGGGPSSNGPVYRYESEFDFESANARFKKEAFEEEFKQLHVDDKSETSSRGVSESNGDDDTPQGEGSEVVVASSEAQAENDVDSADDEFYDKSKSFFDSISCANTGLGRRPDRNAEREMNTETFGVSNFRGHRRYQGRGRGRGRGRGYYGSRGGQRYSRGGDGNYGNKQGRGYSERSKANTGAKQD